MLGESWHCPTCMEEHHGLFDLAADAPYHWQLPKKIEPNSSLRLEGDFLSEDFCVIDGKHFFVRSVVRFDIQGTSESFGFGCWSTLSRTNFETYLETFDSGISQSDVPTQWFGWFSTQILGFEETLNAQCWVVPQPERTRPFFQLHDENHSMRIAQRNGLSIDQLRSIYGAYGHVLPNVHS